MNNSKLATILRIKLLLVKLDCDENLLTKIIK